MKFYNSVFVLVALVAMMISVGAYAANGTRTPSSIEGCGTQQGAEQAALVHAEHDTKAKSCKPTSEAQDFTSGQFFHTYHVTFNCDGKTVGYDSETHEVGTPGNMQCTATVSAARFAAN